MPLISTVISDTGFPLGREGMIATTQPNAEMIVSRAASTELVPGRAVIRGATDNLVVMPSGTTGVFAGVVGEDQALQTSLATVDGNIPATYDAMILTKGRIWVVPEVDVTQGANVYFRHANAGALPEALGRFRDDDDSASGDVTLIEGARWATSAVAGALAQLEVNIP